MTPTNSGSELISESNETGITPSRLLKYLDYESAHRQVETLI